MGSKTTLQILLLALIPYTQENLKLTFIPSRFFNDLAQNNQKHSKQAFYQAYYRASLKGMILVDSKCVKISDDGYQVIKPTFACKLNAGTLLLVVFDVPESIRNKRQKLRSYLKSLGFKQIQKSVWSSDLDFREEVKSVITELDIGYYVRIFESKSI